MIRSSDIIFLLIGFTLVISLTFLNRIKILELEETLENQNILIENLIEVDRFLIQSNKVQQEIDSFIMNKSYK